MRTLKVEKIKKHFGSNTVLNEISFELEENKIYGLLGRNGAGKSTLLNIINNRIKTDSGLVRLGGEVLFESDEHLKQLFLMNDYQLFPEDLKIKDAFALAAALYPEFNQDYCNHLIDIFEVNTKTKISKLSTGYQSIFKLILALCVPVKYVFLDEPVLGLDATHREMFYEELLDSYQKNPRTFVISTHLIEEISHLIETVIFLHKGKILKNADVEELLANSHMITGENEFINSIESSLNVIGEESLGNLKTIYVMDSDISEHESNPQLTVQNLDLQKLFVQLTKKER